MGRLRAPDRDLEIELPTRCLVGRAPACDLVLDGKTVSVQVGMNLIVVGSKEAKPANG